MGSYYLILGVPRDETSRGIRAAYHDRAKELHPDHADTGDATAFRELKEAYEVLSDPERRRRYDRQLRLDEGRPPGRSRPGHPRVRTEPPRARPEPMIPTRPQAEPLVPEPMEMLRDFHTVRSSHDALHDRLLRNFTGVGVPKAERMQPLTVEVELTPDQAVRGVTVPLGIPVFRTCPRCGGSGSDWLFPCLACGQEGVVEESRRVQVEVPPGVRPGSIFELPLEGLGIDNLYLRLAVTVTG